MDATAAPGAFYWPRHGEAVSSPPPQEHLARPVAWGSVLLTAAVALAWGVLAGLTLANTSAGGRADRALSLAALTAFPTPLWLLGLLSTPPHAACRRMLGQDARQVLAAAVRSGAIIIATSATAPLALLAVAIWRPEAAEDLQRCAALIACAAVGSGLWGLAALARALERIALGLQEAWRALAGGGVFGPAETAPLLYAPAFAFVIALLPAAAMAAAWGAGPDLLPPPTAGAVALAALVVAGASARRSLTRLSQRAQAALLIVEQAHATPFAQAEAQPSLPAWFRPAASGLSPAGAAGLVFMGRSWIRRFPASAPATLALVAIAAAALRDAHNPLAVAAACLAIAAYSMTRAVDLDRLDPAVAGASRWLGATTQMQRQMTHRLTLALVTPAAAALVLGATTGAWAAAIAGTGAGGALASLLLRRSKGPALASWTGRLLLVLALLMAAAPMPVNPSPPVVEVQP